jgi:hypothetical protein
MACTDGPSCLIRGSSLCERKQYGLWKGLLQLYTYRVINVMILCTFLVSISLYYSVAVVRKRTIPTKRPPLVGEVSASQPLRVEGVAWSAQRIPTAVNLGFLDQRYPFIADKNELLQS